LHLPEAQTPIVSCPSPCFLLSPLSLCKSMPRVHTGMPVTRLQIILCWLLLFSLSPYSALGALASPYHNVEFRREGEPNGSEQLNSLEDGEKGGGGSNSHEGNSSHSTGHLSTLRKQGIAGVVIATLPVALLLILALRWFRMRQRNKANTPADPASQAELAPKPQDVDSSTTIRELPPTPSDSESLDTGSDETARSQPPVRSLNHTSSFVLPYLFSSDTDRPSRSFTLPTTETHRSNPEDTYADSSYFESAFTAAPAIPPILPMLITTPTKTVPSHARRTSFISATNVSPPSPSQWLSRSPGSRPTSVLQEDMVIGYQQRLSLERAADFSASKKLTPRLTSLDITEEQQTP